MSQLKDLYAYICCQFWVFPPIITQYSIDVSFFKKWLILININESLKSIYKYFISVSVDGEIDSRNVNRIFI